MSTKNVNKSTTIVLDEKLLKSTESKLKIHAKALGIPSGAAESFIEKSIKSATDSLKNKSLITDTDFTRALKKELKKYHADLAYVYENYDKII